MIIKDDVNFLLNAYDGTGGFADGSYLTQFPRETDTAFKERKTRAHYKNFVRKLVNIYVGFLTQRDPTRQTDDLYSQFALNADGAGHHLDTVLVNFIRLTLITGTTYIIVDKPQGIAATMAEEKLPYLSIRLRNQLINYKKNFVGQFEECTFSENYDAGYTQTGLRYRKFTKTTWEILDENMGVIESGEHNLGRVPVITFHIAQPLKPCDHFSRTFINDVADLALKLYRLDSNQMEVSNDTSFPLFTLPASSQEERESLRNGSVVIGTKNALVYDPTNGGKPSYVSPEAVTFEQNSKLIAETVEAIYTVANFEFFGSVHPSGEALSWHFMGANMSLGTIAEMCEQMETSIAQLVYLWFNREFTGSISYNKEFNLAAIKDSIGNALDAMTLNIGQTFDNALKKKTAREVLGNTTSIEVMTEIDKEIDAGGDVYANRIQQAAGLTP